MKLECLYTFLILLFNIESGTCQKVELTFTKINSINKEGKIEISYALKLPTNIKFVDINAIATISGTQYNLNDQFGETINGDIGIQKASDAIKNITIKTSQLISEDARTLLLKLNAIPYERFSSKRYYLKSLLVPGWGTGDLRKGEMNKFYAIGSYLLLGAGLGFYLKAKSDYNSYLPEKNLHESDQKYSKALNELNIANYLFAGFGVAWTADLIRLTINLNQKKKTLEHIDNNYYYLKDKKDGVTAGCKVWLN